MPTGFGSGHSPNFTSRAPGTVATWLWVKMKPPEKPQLLVDVSSYKGKPFWGCPTFDQPHDCTTLGAQDLIVEASGGSRPSYLGSWAAGATSKPE